MPTRNQLKRAHVCLTAKQIETTLTPCRSYFVHLGPPSMTVIAMGFLKEAVALPPDISCASGNSFVSFNWCNASHTTVGYEALRTSAALAGIRSYFLRFVRTTVAHQGNLAKSYSRSQSWKCSPSFLRLVYHISVSYVCKRAYLSHERPSLSQFGTKSPISSPPLTFTHYSVRSQMTTVKGGKEGVCSSEEVSCSLERACICATMQ